MIALPGLDAQDHEGTIWVGELFRVDLSELSPNLPSTLHAKPRTMSAFQIPNKYSSSNLGSKTDARPCSASSRSDSLVNCRLLYLSMALYHQVYL